MKWLFILLLLISGAAPCFPQVTNPAGPIKNDSAGIKSIVSALVRYASVSPVEKVYLHLDKPAYAPGDIIWYKAYTVIGPWHQPSTLSGVLYVELTGPKDSVVSREVIKLNSGLGVGDITLSALMPQGNYRLRAYTNWMRNAGADYFYDQPIQIGIPARGASVQSSGKQPDIQFFPEGGSLVNDVRSRVAVKAVDTTGLGIDIAGTIKDNEGDTITTFTTRHLGMGIFALTPVSGKTYSAVIKITGRSDITVNLPPAADTGITLTVNNNGPDSLYMKVATNEKTISQQKDNLFYLVAQSGGKIFYTTAGKLTGAASTAGVDKKRFPSGIAQVTLFNGNGQPVAERIAFIQNDDSLRINTTLTPGSHSDGAQKLTLQVKNGERKPVQGNFSVAVINEDEVAYNRQAEGSIITNLLLTSDLKGYIENPGYYFMDNSRETRAAMDVLMLTQGYRRFAWKNIQQNTVTAPDWQPEKSLSVEGYVKTGNNKPVPGMKVSLAAMQTGVFIDTAADADGHFSFTNLDLADSTQVMVRPAGKTTRDDIKISVVPTAYAPPATKAEPIDTGGTPTAVLVSLKKRYDDLQAGARLKNARQLKEVVIKAKKIEPDPVPYSANLNGAGMADQVLKGDQLSNCPTLSDCLQGRLFGVRFSPKTGAPINSRNNGAMIIIVDGMLEGGSRLNEINADQISTIEVLRSGGYLAIYGNNASRGALIITLKKGADVQNVQSDIANYVFKGYYKARTFYAPKYDHAQTDAGITAPPATVYWNPNVGSDKDGNAPLQYFNSTTKGNYRIVIEGIDDDGNIGRKVLRYKAE